MTKGTRGDAGVSAVEFGLVLPLLLVVLLGLIDYGWVFFVRLTMTNAAREGARAGITQDAAMAGSTAVSEATEYLGAAGLTADVSASTPSDADGSVRVVVTVDPFVPLVGFVPTPNRMQVAAAMRWELAGL